MAKNDRLLIDGVLDERVSIALPSDKRDEAFEYLVVEQILKDLDFSPDELLSGLTDGRQDGGIDGFYIVVNGHLLQDVESFGWPRTGSELRVAIITSKHHDTYKQSPLDTLIATFSELLDFAIDEKQLQGAYSQTLLRMRANLMYAYRRLSPRLASFSLGVYYASRGDTTQIGEEVRSRAAQITELVTESFGGCNAEFVFVGATELIQLLRRTRNYTLELPFVDALAKGERYVVLVRLRDFYDFVSEEGRLRRYLFDSNVRDFMGRNRVNEDIAATLHDADSPDFWWLNNGVTILASSAAITGKSIQATDVQIVNGLQTTECIFRHFEQSDAPDERCLLVKVIVTKDESVRDDIIRATNNQTDVELASLHATDKIQRDIEDVLRLHGLFYERRKNFYANQGQPLSELVTPLYAAAGYIALVMKAPHAAASLRSKFMRSSESYDAVFSPDAPLTVWPKIVRVLKCIDAELESLRPAGRPTERFLKGWRYILGLLLVAQHFGKYTFSAEDLSRFDTDIVTRDAIEELWHELNRFAATDRRFSGWNSLGRVKAACGYFADRWGITGAAMVGGRWVAKTDRSGQTLVTEEFVEKVRATLPPQPWKPGIHRTVSEQLRCSTDDYFAAVEKLIADGVFLQQKDGVLYDVDGNVVSFDSERVDPDTLELRSK